MSAPGRCILVCAGEFDPSFDPREKTHFPSLSKEDLLIAVDGGLRHILDLGLEPDLILGDFDSIAGREEEYLERFEARRPESVIRLPVQKDETDSEKAVTIGLERGFARFFIYGALGGRFDHSFSNLQMALKIRRKGARPWLFLGRTAITVIENETFRLPEGFEGTVSLCALSDRLEGVSIKDMKYELTDAVIANDSSLGISNETVPGNGPGAFSIQKGAGILILTEHLHNIHY